MLLMMWVPTYFGRPLGSGLEKLELPQQSGTSLRPQVTVTISSRMPFPQTAWAVSPSAGSRAGECLLPLGHRLGSWLGRAQGTWLSL